MQLEIGCEYLYSSRSSIFHVAKCGHENKNERDGKKFQDDIFFWWKKTKQKKIGKTWKTKLKLWQGIKKTKIENSIIIIVCVRERERENGKNILE